MIKQLELSVSNLHHVGPKFLLVVGALHLHDFQNPEKKQNYTFRLLRLIALGFTLKSCLKTFRLYLDPDNYPWIGIWSLMNSSPQKSAF